MSTRVTVTRLPKCDFHGSQHDAEYNFRTRSGQWGNGCEQAWIDYRLHDTLGTGKGQKLVVADPEQPHDIDCAEFNENGSCIHSDHMMQAGL